MCVCKNIDPNSPFAFPLDENNQSVGCKLVTPGRCDALGLLPVNNPFSQTFDCILDTETCEAEQTSYACIKTACTPVDFIDFSKSTGEGSLSDFIDNYDLNSSEINQIVVVKSASTQSLDEWEQQYDED